MKAIQLYFIPTEHCRFVLFFCFVSIDEKLLTVGTLIRNGDLMRLVACWRDTGTKEDHISRGREDVHNLGSVGEIEVDA